jgi:hypothetical protein
MDAMNLLLEKMELGLIVSRLLLADSDVEVALDGRDGSAFENDWLEVSNQIKSRKRNLDDADIRVTRLRELSYLQTFDRWDSPDLAAEISDDFGLIGDALAIAYDHPWLSGLLHLYLSGSFPTGQIEHSTLGLSEQLRACWKSNLESVDRSRLLCRA